MKDRAAEFSRMFEDSEIDFSASKFKDLTWESEFYVANADDITFIGSEKLPEEVSNLQAPFQFWSYFVSDEIITHLVEQTNVYATQSSKKQPLNVNNT